MIIIPKLVLDEKDLAPFIELLKKRTGETGEFIITSIIPVTTGNGNWTVEIGAEPVKHSTDVKA